MADRRRYTPLDTATRAAFDAYELKIKVLEAQARMLRWDLAKVLALATARDPVA